MDQPLLYMFYREMLTWWAVMLSARTQWFELMGIVRSPRRSALWFPQKFEPVARQTFDFTTSTAFALTAQRKKDDAKPKLRCTAHINCLHSFSLFLQQPIHEAFLNQRAISSFGSSLSSSTRSSCICTIARSSRRIRYNFQRITSC